ncbi:MAG: glutamate 5-kinase [Salinivirgaceae bacterium]
MNSNSKIYQRIAIKIGSNLLAGPDGSLNSDRIAHLVKQIAKLHKKGLQVILISSGAVASGKGEFPLSKKTGEVASKQVWAAIGQVKLMAGYFSMFAKYGIQAAQVLTTKENFGDRRHYLNMKSCISAMLENEVLPIVNENDTIAVTELMFTDNDELSGLIAAMMNCQALFILSNVDGVYTGVPGTEGAELIPLINSSDKNIYKHISPVKSGFGRGGMLTKFSIAQKIASQGIEVFIANGTRNNILTDIIDGKEVPFSKFIPSLKKVNGVKKWLLHSDTFAKGAVTVNKGAEQALNADKASSLLTVGIQNVEGFFEKGDIVKVVNTEGKILGIGKSQYSSEEAVKTIGQKRSKPFIHYDYLVLNEK